ncbi:MAG: sugar ABC transporter permease [bacterium]|nr:sugar ABC transporter permease [bacterium]
MGQLSTPSDAGLIDINRQGSARRVRLSLKTRESLMAYIFLAPFLFFFFVFVLRSVVFGGWISLHRWPILAPDKGYVAFNNYVSLMNDSLWWTALQNTVVFAALTVAGTTVLSLLAALALNRPLPGQSFFRILFYMPSLLSVSVVAIAWSWLLNTDFGIINYGLQLLGLPKVNWTGDANLVLITLSLVTIWWGFGFPTLVFLAGLRGIPEPLYEAAKIDGAGGWALFWYITLPLLRPTLLFVTVTGFISHFQVFGQPYLMTNQGGPGRASFTVIMYIFQTAWRFFNLGYASAMALTLAAILMILTLIQFRFGGRRVEY